MLGVRWTELSDGETSASQKEAQHVSYTEVTQRRGYDAAEQGGGVITYRQTRRQGCYMQLDQGGKLS